MISVLKYNAFSLYGELTEVYWGSIFYLETWLKHTALIF